MNYYVEWWDQARKQTGILTKQTYLKSLDKKIKDLEAGKSGKAFLKLQQEKANAKKHAKDLQQNLTNLQAEYDSSCEEITELKFSVNNLLEQIKQLGEDKQNLSKLSAEQIQRIEREKEVIKRNFTNGSAVGNTHWIYWKNKNDKLQQEISKQEVINKNQLKEWNTLASEKDRELTARAKLIADLEEQLDFSNSKIKQLNPLFNSLLATLKKNIILRGKKELKETITNIQELMQWEKISFATGTNTPEASET